MTIFELSRPGFDAAENPNRNKPKLTLGGKSFCDRGRV
jgi:hypothetical protein